MPVRANFIQFRECLPPNEVNRPARVRPDNEVIGHKSETGMILNRDPLQDQRVKRRAMFTRNDHVCMHRTTKLSVARRYPAVPETIGRCVYRVNSGNTVTEGGSIRIRRGLTDLSGHGSRAMALS